MDKKKLALTMAVATTLTVSSVSSSIPTIVYAQENVVEDTEQEVMIPEEYISNEDLSVTNTEELKNVLSKVKDGVETTIYIDSSFELQESITITGKNLKLVGRNDEIIITAGQNVSGNMFLFYSSQITFENIVLNGNDRVGLYSSNLDYLPNDSCTVTLNSGAVLTHGKTANNRTSTLIMNEGSEISYCTGTQGGAINLWPSGTFIMNGGELKNNSAQFNGGAIDANVSAKVIINGGVISGNSNTPNNVGGAISVRNGSTLEIKGGKITENISGYGDVIGVSGSNNTVIMTGGEISNNKHSNKTDVSNGIYVGDLSGGLIVNNEAAVIAKTISGSPVVKGNLTKDKHPIGLCGSVTHPVEIVGTLTDGAYIETRLGENQNNLEYFIGNNYSITASDVKKLHVINFVDSKGLSIAPYFLDGVIKGQKVYLDGGSVPEYIDYENKLIKPIKKGYRFEGWFENKEFTVGPIEELVPSKAYFAKWIEKTVPTISFKDNFNLDKTYDGKTVSISEKDYTVTNGAGDVTFLYQVKNGDTWSDIDSAPINAGTYRVKAVVAENDNYKGAKTDWKEFIISKADSDVIITTKSLDKVYDGNTVNEPKYTITGSSKEVVFKWYIADDSGWKKLDNVPVNVGTYKVVVSVEADDNYNGATASKAFKISQATNEITKPSMKGWTYGEEANMPSATVKFGDAKDIVYTYSSTKEGTYTTTVPTEAGTWYVKAYLKGTLDYTDATSESCEFTISQATPSYIIPTDLKATYGNTLKDVELPIIDNGVYTWKDSKESLDKVGTNKFIVVFTPNDTKNYKTVEFEVNVEIEKANPTYKIPTGLTSVQGKTLADVKLPDGFTWEVPETTSLDKLGLNKFTVTYTPKDTNNYNVVNGIEVTVTVNPKMEELNNIPTIDVEDKTLTVGDAFDPLKDVVAIDKEDGELTDTIKVIENTVDTTKAGVYEVIYKVTDSKGASSIKTIKVTVNEKLIPLEPSEPIVSEVENGPGTGDQTIMNLYVSIAMICGMLIGLVMMIRRKKQINKYEKYLVYKKL